jgi:hypothetical protein
LKNCVLFLGAEVVDPLEEFEFGMKFARDSLRETCSRQHDALHGTPAPKASHSASSASLTVSGSSSGVRGLLEQVRDAQKKHLELKSQLDSLGDKIRRQKEIAASSLHFSKRRRAGLSRAEELHRVQVERWCTVSQHLDVSLDRVREQIEDSRVRRGVQNPQRPQHQHQHQQGAPPPSRKKSFMTPTRPRAAPGHLSSPHRISFRNSPANGKPCRVSSASGSRSGTSSFAPESPTASASARIRLQDEERDSCLQLQLETGHLQEALRQKVGSVEARLSRLAMSSSSL